MYNKRILKNILFYNGFSFIVRYNSPFIIFKFAYS